MRRLALVTVVALSGCGSTFPALKLRELPGAETYPSASLVNLLDETEVSFRPGGKDGGPQAVVTNRLRVRVLKPTELPSLRVWYDVGFSRIERIAGRIVAPDGRETPLDTSKQSDRAFFASSVLFSGNRVVVVPVPPVPVGGVYEYEVVKTFDDLRPFLVSHQFRDTSPTEVSRLVASAPADWAMRWTVQSPEEATLAPTVETSGGRTRWVFERQKLPAYEKEERGVPLWAAATMVAVRLERWTANGTTEHAFATPAELSAWLAQQYAQKAAPTPEMVQTVGELLQGVPDTPDARAAALYEYACRRVQYCAIELGYGGWIPHDSASVHTARYGDCKDKANYLRALLDIAGIPSSPTLIYAHDGVPRPFLLPSLAANFNHAILAVHLPGRTVYADPTHRAVPFGELPPSDADAPVLQLSPGGEDLKRTPQSDPALNLESERLELTLDTRGHAAGRFTITARGANAATYKNQVLLSTGKLDTFMEKRLSLRSVVVSEVKAEEMADFAPQARVTGRLLTRNLVSRGAHVAVLRPADVLSLSTTLVATPRHTAVVFPSNETRESELVVALPPGLTASRLPSDFALESPFGRYQLAWRLDGGTLHLTRRYVRTQRVIPASQVEEANRFFEAVLLAETTPAVLRWVRREAR